MNGFRWIGRVLVYGIVFTLIALGTLTFFSQQIGDTFLSNELLAITLGVVMAIGVTITHYLNSQKDSM